MTDSPVDNLNVDASEAKTESVHGREIVSSMRLLLNMLRASLPARLNFTCASTSCSELESKYEQANVSCNAERSQDRDDIAASSEFFPV